MVDDSDKCLANVSSAECKPLLDHMMYLKTQKDNSTQKYH